MEVLLLFDIGQAKIASIVRRVTGGQMVQMHQSLDLSRCARGLPVEHLAKSCTSAALLCTVRDTE